MRSAIELVPAVTEERVLPSVLLEPMNPPVVLTA